METVVHKVLTQSRLLHYSLAPVKATALRSGVDAPVADHSLIVTMFSLNIYTWYVGLVGADY